MDNIKENFGINVFGDREMKKYLSEETYNKIQLTIRNGKSLDKTIADEVADGMMKWAMERGATHFTHWFQPLSGVTAEKHDSFICMTREGDIKYGFSGKELIKGESDASSFPSGGLRATFEARGYTAWDPTSYAFVKGNTLCIPTAFCSYGGHALDKKTPLLRSMEQVNKATMRVLKAIGNDDIKSVNTTVGAEQEYFLVPAELFEQRKDLVYTGRTLFGARSPKGQELDDHYYGSIKPRVAAFMKDVDEELWKLGIPSKTEHNEAAPAQHELAPIFTTSNIATDQNQLTMEVLRTTARKHQLVCLLHEKPFAGVNGSGKHNNWSINADNGVNLLKPGDTPYENAQFLLFLTAVIAAVDDYQELLRISVSGAGNDHRLGGNEAPPAIISISLGDELTQILESIENGTAFDQKEREMLRIGVHVIPKFPRDTTDRNRTSPIAFTGNKFEFRMPGGPASMSDITTVINTAVAAKLNKAADLLEGVDDYKAKIHEVIRDSIRRHKRIIFNGNGYSTEWKEEAARRGLSNLPSTPDALKHYLDEKNVGLMTSMKIFTADELEARHEIMLENYVKLNFIEGITMVDMARKELLPAISKYRRDLLSAGENMSGYETDTAESLGKYLDAANRAVKKLDKSLAEGKKIANAEEQADYCLNTVLPLMKKLRDAVDAAELITAENYWPHPTYGQLMFGISD